MDTRTGRCAFLCTLSAGLCSLAVPAAAANSGLPAAPSGPVAGLAGHILGDEALAAIRARYILPGSTVIVQIGNGDDTSTTYYQRDPATPGSAMVSVTGSTTTTAYAATGGPGTNVSVSRTLSVSRSFSSRH
ncbi:hypothetical protein [Sphingosinicella rhizophila]|uniref:Uncharacterized protein n=1 Tax=Sphingosinicella rhizophila TaxID=3050082 RepID=A0ABU3Q8U1_9SPHN|nr:hypothetical protein [Sphingosinicella sp. GR2756]MDT9599819.1 hypothetical protein [Sphingosinicella sp. GR2756]